MHRGKGTSKCPCVRRRRQWESLGTGSVNKRVCSQALGPEFDPKNPHGGRREPSPVSTPWFLCQLMSPPDLECHWMTQSSSLLYSTRSTLPLPFSDSKCWSHWILVTWLSTNSLMILSSAFNLTQGIWECCLRTLPLRLSSTACKLQVVSPAPQFLKVLCSTRLASCPFWLSMKLREIVTSLN